MSHENWDDNKIEQLLSNAPRIQDNRSKEDVLQRLKNDGVFDDEPSDFTIKNKKKFNWIPSVVTVAVLCLIAILIPSFISKINQSDTTGNLENVQKAEEEKNTDSNKLTEKEHLRSAIYPEDIKENTVFKIGLVSDAADSIPVTILIPNKKISEDFGKGKNPTGVELYNKYAPILDESVIGFADYHPYVGKIEDEGNRVIHILPNNQTYDIASASMSAYTASLIDTFSSYDEIEFRNEDGTPVIFSQVGEPSKPLKTKGEMTQYNYFRYTQANGSEYLVPNFRTSYSNVEEAIKAMKDETNDIYKSVILPNVDYNIKVQDKIVTVEFVSKIDLKSYDQVKAMQMIEGILLTAASFNMQVQFENIVQTEWEGFDFTSPLPIPVGANEIPISVLR